MGSIAKIGCSSRADLSPVRLPVICPMCKASFIPRTTSQSLCKLKCYVEKRTKKGPAANPAVSFTPSKRKGPITPIH